LYNRVFATAMLDRLTRRCDIAYATQLGNHHQVTGAPFSTVIGSSWRVTIRRPAGGNRDNLTGVDRNRTTTDDRFRATEHAMLASPTA
jgi:hypothetical protein